MKLHQQRLYDSQAIRALEALAGGRDEHGRSILMERAGLSALDLMQGLFRGVRSVTIVCGSGNNGGDGFVMARLAHKRGLVVNAVIINEPKADDAHVAWEAMLASGVQPVRYRTVDALPAADVIVDALFGIGLDRAPEGEYLRIINEINASGALVLSLDVPSGLNADTGHIPGVAVNARATVTFLGLKPGLLTGRGREVCGEIVVAPLDIAPSTLRDIKPVMFRITEDSLRAVVPRRAPTAHKGSNGHVLVIGGDEGMGGAAALCAEAALRVGAGLVSVLTHPAHAAAIMASRPELMIKAATLDQSSDRKTIDRMLSKATVIALGPGLGQRDFGDTLYRYVMDWRRRQSTPLVLDADGLNHLAKSPARLDRFIMTPHPGEAARLLDTATAAVSADRPAALTDLVAQYGGVAVLKGAGTLIGDDTDVWLCDKGNAGMATGGMGDVLTGIIAGLVAQRMAHIDAARLGVWLHAVCADDCAAKEGQLGLLPSDLIREVRGRLNALAEADSKPTATSSA